MLHGHMTSVFAGLEVRRSGDRGRDHVITRARPRTCREVRSSSWFLGQVGGRRRMAVTSAIER